MHVSRQILFYLKISLFWLISGILFNRYIYRGGFIITAIALILYFTLKKEEKFIFILSAVPMAAIFKISSNLPSSIILLYFIYIFEYYYNKRKINKRFLEGMLLFGISQFITILVFGADFISIVSFSVNIIFCKTAYERLKVVSNKSFVFKESGITFSLIMMINILLAFKYPNMAFSISYVKQKALESAGRFAALNGDPNYYSQLVAVALCLLVAIILMKEVQIFQKIILSSLFVFLMVNGLKSGSKSFVLVLLFLLVLLTVLFIRNSKKNKKWLFKVVVISGVGIILSIYLINDIILPLFWERSLDNTTLLSNRDVIWRKYIYNFLNRPSVWWIGAGIMNGGKILADGAAAHNVYFELLAETGLLGIGCIVYGLGDIFRRFRELFKNIDMLFVWALIITSFGLSLSSNDAMFILLPLIALIEESRGKYEYIKENSYRRYKRSN